MCKIILIDGGFGRSLAAIPSLLKFDRLNKDKEWYVGIYGWDFVTLGIPELQNRTFNPDNRNSFQNYFLKADEIITP